MRKFIQGKLKGAGIDRIEIERSPHEVVINLFVARPGLVIGRGGATIEALRKELSKEVEGKLTLNVNQVNKPQLSTRLVAEEIARKLERRISHKRAVNRALQQVMEAGASGVKVQLSGRLDGVTIARTEKRSMGRVPLQTIDAKIDYAHVDAFTKYGIIGVKVWINKE